MRSQVNDTVTSLNLEGSLNQKWEKKKKKGLLMSYCVELLWPCKPFYSSLFYVPRSPISCLLLNQLAPAETTDLLTQRRRQYWGIRRHRVALHKKKMPICNNYNLIDRQKKKQRGGDKRRLGAPLRSGVARCISPPHWAFLLTGRCHGDHFRMPTTTTECLARQIALNLPTRQHDHEQNVRFRGESVMLKRSGQQRFLGCK